MMRSTLAVTSVAALFATAAYAQSPVKLGTLDCDVAGGIGMIIASKKEMACAFTPATPGPIEAYRGSISRFGLDVGATNASRIVWVVYAPSSGRQSLSGTYAGATAEATFGAGLGANVLIGGSNRTIALQPVSLQEQSGLNVAAGVAELRLRAAN
jgi:hypothetical protein